MVPQSLQEAQGRTDWPHWKAAMEVEIQGFKRLNVYSEILTLPQGEKAVGARWVFDLKKDDKGVVIR